MSAMPSPIVMPPIICERAVFGLMMRPQSNTLVKRVTRNRARSSSKRTSQKCAPNE